MQAACLMCISKLQSVGDPGNCDIRNYFVVTFWPEGCKEEGENHRSSLNVSHWGWRRGDGASERASGWRKGRRDVGILVPAALVLQAPLTSAQRARERSPLPISTDGLRGASCSRKKYKTTVRLLLSFLLHTSHRPWPSLSHFWQVKPFQGWVSSRATQEKQRRLSLFEETSAELPLQIFVARASVFAPVQPLYMSVSRPWSYWAHCTPATT